MKLVLSKGTTWFASQTGEYNFYYPDFNRVYQTTVPTEVTRLNWLAPAGYIAVQVSHLTNHTPCKVLWLKESNL